MTGIHHLRVLIANQRPERLELLSAVVSGLGHDVIAREVRVAEVARVTARERPDLALVGLGESSEHALKLISEIVKGSFCPVIALLPAFDGAWIDEAARRGVYAYIVDSRPEELQSAIDITLRRYADFEELQGAFGRREATARRESAAQERRQRQVLELHDGVVQSLGIAHLALELDHSEQSSEALLDALEQTKAIVGRAIADLQEEGVPLAQLIRDMAPH